VLRQRRTFRRSPVSGNAECRVGVTMDCLARERCARKIKIPLDKEDVLRHPALAVSWKSDELRLESTRCAGTRPDRHGHQDRALTRPRGASGKQRWRRCSRVIQCASQPLWTAWSLLPLW
jgi:hypothetical protein